MKYTEIKMEHNNHGTTMIDANNTEKKVNILYDLNEIDFSKIEKDKFKNSIWRRDEYIVKVIRCNGQVLQETYKTEYFTVLQTLQIVAGLIQDELDTTIKSIEIRRK